MEQLNTITTSLKENRIFLDMVTKRFRDLSTTFADNRVNKDVIINVNDFLRFPFPIQYGLIIEYLYKHHGIFITSNPRTIIDEPLSNHVSSCNAKSLPVKSYEVHKISYTYEDNENPFCFYRFLIIKIFDVLAKPF